MELQQLKYFLDVAQTQNMTASSKRVGIAQPALSHSMKRLESELGVRLFERVGRNIRLTREGEHLAGLLKPAIAAVDAIPEKVRDFAKDEQQTVEVGMHSASKLVIAAIAEYKARNPKAKFRISQDPSGACDVSVRTVRGDASGPAAPSGSMLFRERIGVAWGSTPSAASTSWREGSSWRLRGPRGSGASATSCALRGASSWATP